jgi:hypothetical protein
MEALRVLDAFHRGDEEKKKFLLHETKYALLASALFVIFLFPWSKSLVRNTFPGAKGPIVYVYMIIFYGCIYYIIQKSSWFQQM